MTITEIDNPRILDKDVRRWRGFSGRTQAAAVEEFTRLYPEYARAVPVAVWCRTNLTLFVPWDWRR
jgi:hypothetical protein